MQNAIFRFEQLLNENSHYFPTIDPIILEEKKLGKWPKKEVSGHLEHHINQIRS